MRPTSKKIVCLRGVEIGGKYPLICLPLVAEDLNSLLGQAREIVTRQPDLIEWRADHFTLAMESEAVKTALFALRSAIGDIPLIITCRSVEEGGFQDIPLKSRMKLLGSVLQTRQVDLIDFEISNGPGAIAEIREITGAYQAKLILSYHNFQITPDPEFILAKLTEGCRLGADIVKAAVMPRDYQDVLNLFSATLQARNETVDIPMITMAMGDIGRISRTAGAFFGSDVSFAVGRKISAPGQIPVEDLRSIWKVFEF